MNHFNISLIKSGLRIGSLILLLLIEFIPNIIYVFIILFILAEFLGILEEVYDKRKE